ncbi:MAG: tannase/feruloyl esterase family alpha/beta hydrolase [Acidobacteriia bacterium]|nr:tannase/feruloyl esterase family alpha/beta hydrolase [Terriglobia bacterium]
MIGTDHPDLSAFRDHGGKAIVWHGWADQLITADGTINYYKRVQQQMGGAEVENGTAPETLTAARRDQTGAITRSRPLCQYPLVARYKGTGSTDEASSFVCSAGF